MNRFSFSTKFLVAATLATAALGAATVAEARPEVFVSIGLQDGPGWVEPTRGYFQPQPVYVQPRPVFVEPAPVFLRPPAFGRYDARIEWERERAWRHAEWRHAEWRRHERHEQFRGGDHDRDDHGDHRGHGGRRGWRD